MTSAQFESFLTEALGNAAAHCRDGAIAFVCMDWRRMGELLTAGSAVFSELQELCVWSKTNGGMGSFYRSQHELVFVYKVGAVAHMNTFELGQPVATEPTSGPMPASTASKPDAAKKLRCIRR